MHTNLKGKVAISFDFSGFDRTVPAWLIKDVFTIIENHIDFSKMTLADKEISLNE